MAKRAKETVQESKPTTQEAPKMSANFSDVLNKKLDTIEKPKPLPVGTYYAVVNGAPEIKPRGNNNTLSAEFKFKILQPDEDVDAEQLAAAGGLQKEREMRFTLWLTEDALWRAKQFVENCGVDDSNVSLSQALQACVGCQVKVKVVQKPSQDGAELYANIDKILKI